MTRVPALAVSLLWLALQSGASAANVDSGARSGAGLSHLSIEELAEIERGIEARREGLHVLSDDERAGIEEAERSNVVSEEEVAQFWKRRVA